MVLQGPIKYLLHSISPSFPENCTNFKGGGGGCGVGGGGSQSVPTIQNVTTHGIEYLPKWTQLEISGFRILVCYIKLVDASGSQDLLPTWKFEVLDTTIMVFSTKFIYASQRENVDFLLSFPGFPPSLPKKHKFFQDCGNPDMVLNSCCPVKTSLTKWIIKLSDLPILQHHDFRCYDINSIE